MENRRIPSRTRIEITWKTIFKVLISILLVFVVIKLWPVIKLIVVATLLAVPLYQLVKWMCRKGYPRWTGLTLASLLLVSAVVGCAAVIGPMAFREAGEFAKSLPKLMSQLMSRLPTRGPLREAFESAFGMGKGLDIQQFSQQALSTATTTLSGLLDLVLVVALTIYFMSDGPRALNWLIAFFDREYHGRIRRGLEEIESRIVGYVVGQLMVSGLFALYVFTVLSLLHIPMGLFLALIAGILDVIPVVGISITVVLVGLLGLTVSPTTALLALGLMSLYHAIENYLIIPKVYGKKLRLSNLAVLLSMIIGGTLAGAIGAVAALPLAAAYPALEGLWLDRSLDTHVVEEHRDQLRAA